MSFVKQRWMLTDTVIIFQTTPTYSEKEFTAENEAQE